MKRPPVGVNDSIIEFIASDDRDTMDEWLATLHREPCPPPVELPAAVAELIADWRSEAE